MKRILSLILFLSSSLALLAQEDVLNNWTYEDGNQFYIVSDADGYVNVRKEPSNKAEVAFTVETKRLVVKDPDNVEVGGWIPILDTGKRENATDKHYFILAV